MSRRSVRRAAPASSRAGWRAAMCGLMAGLLAAPLAVAVPSSPGSGTAAAAGPETLEVVGRGNGHGIGMSQWGAYGYAADHGWSADQILAHYYGGTVAGTTDATSITVRLMNLDNRQTAVVHDKGALVVDGVGSSGGPWRSVVVREIADRNYGVWVRSDASVCPAADDPLTGWTQVASGLGTVTVRPSTDTSASTDVSDLAAVCEPSGRLRSYRGVIRAVNGTEGENRTVNEVPLEQYLRAVVASEMSASWAPRGSAALQAQAIAARSFGLAENRYSYARTCDQICQFYPGAAWRTSVTGAYTRTEHASVDAAVQATAGRVRRVGTTAGPIALTMFSSSSGGWTSPSTLPFPAVQDVGDATSGNPHHRWRATIAVSAITKAWPQIGDFTGVTITSRNGHGEWGGRVLTVTVAGTTGSVSLTGDAFRRAVGLRSNWFDITGAATAEGIPDAGGSAATNRCEGRDEPAIGAAPAAAPAARFEPIVPVRLVDTRDGTGTIARPLVGGCTLRIEPEVPAGTTAVSVNVVTVDPVSQGYVTVYPCGIARPFTSAVQSQVGRIVSGSAIVPLGADGSFCVFSNTTTEIVVDINGSFAPSASARYEPIVTQRRFDSRPSGRRLAAGEVVRVQTRGFGGGAADSTAASVTIHGLDAAASGFITAWPCDTPRPWASSANVMIGSSVSNEVDVAVGATGEICFLVSAPMHLSVDLNGWYGPSATTDYYAVTPFRLADTRESFGFAGAFRRNVDRPIQVAGVGGLPAPGTVRSVAAQFTAVDGAGTGWVTVHPCLSPVPPVSMLRYEARTNVAVLVNTVLSANGRWCVSTSTNAHLVVDVSGWFG